MPLLYRSMVAHPDGMPVFVGTPRGLAMDGNVLFGRDGTVSPGTGGLTVCHEAPSRLPAHRRPPSHGGTGPDPIWAIDSDDLPGRLTHRADSGRPELGFLEPTEPISLFLYEDGLLSTRKRWRRVDPPDRVPPFPRPESRATVIGVLETARHEPIDVASLGELVRVELRTNDRETVQQRLEALRASVRGDEGKDDVVLEVMDRLSGWCSPHVRI
jgi:hypothetical protein